MNKSTYMTLVNAIAKAIVIEGDQKGAYRAKLSAAHKIVRAGQLADFNELVDFVSIIEGVQATTKKAPKAPKKVAPKKAAPKAPKAPVAIEPAQKIVFNGISHESLLHVYFTDEQIDTVTEYINRFVIHSNKFEGVYMDEKRHMFNDGMKALESVEDMMGLQTAMVTYFLRDYALITIGKFLEMGIGYKKVSKVRHDNEKASAQLVKRLEKNQSYQKASSNNGKIHEYSAMDIYHELVIDSYEMEFDESMFDELSHVPQTLFFRISNVMQSQMTALRKQIKVKEDIKGMYKEYMQQGEQLDEQAFNLAVEMNVFTDAELAIIKMRIAGLEKVEVEKEIGKRSDRAFQSMAKKFEKVNGTREKRDYKAEKAKIAQRKADMKKRLEDEKKAQAV